MTSTIRASLVSSATLAAATLAAALLAAVAGPAAAAGTSGSIQLKGTVQAVCQVAVTDAGHSLNITNGETDRQVGSVVETCNNGTGYTVTVSSANAGQLRNGNAAVAYTLRYDTQSGSLGSAMSVQRAQPQFQKTSPVAITIPATATAAAGNYADTLTITIATR